MKRFVASVFAACLVLAVACSGGSTPVGEACTKDSDCKSGTCQSTPGCSPAMHCVCNGDSDCSEGSHCAMSTNCGNSCGLP